MAADDLRYEPPNRGLSWLEALRPMSCLVMGDIPEHERDTVLRIAPSVRAVTPSGMARRLLHQGTYGFEVGGAWHIVLIAAGREPRSPEGARSRYVEDGHLSFARIFYEGELGRRGSVRR